MTYGGVERRSGKDRRQGPRREEDAGISLEAPGGWKASLTGGRGFIFGALVGAAGTMGVWLYILLKAAH